MTGILGGFNPNNGVEDDVNERYQHQHKPPARFPGHLAQQKHIDDGYEGQKGGVIAAAFLGNHELRVSHVQISGDKENPNRHSQGGKNTAIGGAR